MSRHSNTLDALELESIQEAAWDGFLSTIQTPEVDPLSFAAIVRSFKPGFVLLAPTTQGLRIATPYQGFMIHTKISAEDEKLKSLKDAITLGLRWSEKKETPPDLLEEVVALIATHTRLIFV